MWIAYKELSIIGPHDLDLLIPSMDAEFLVPSPGHVDVEDRYETFRTLCETLSDSTQVVAWVENKVQKAWAAFLIFHVLQPNSTAYPATKTGKLLIRLTELTYSFLAHFQHFVTTELYPYDEQIVMLRMTSMMGWWSGLFNSRKTPEMLRNDTPPRPTTLWSHLLWRAYNYPHEPLLTSSCLSLSEIHARGSTTSASDWSHWWGHISVSTLRENPYNFGVRPSAQRCALGARLPDFTSVAEVGRQWGPILQCLRLIPTSMSRPRTRRVSSVLLGFSGASWCTTA